MDNKFNLFSDEQTMRFCSYSVLNHYVICFHFFQKLQMILTYVIILQVVTIKAFAIVFSFHIISISEQICIWLKSGQTITMLIC